VAHRLGDCYPSACLPPLEESAQPFEVGLAGEVWVYGAGPGVYGVQAYVEVASQSFVGDAQFIEGIGQLGSELAGARLPYLVAVEAPFLQGALLGAVVSGQWSVVDDGRLLIADP
jgi:hypothetical protein